VIEKFSILIFSFESQALFIRKYNIENPNRWAFEKSIPKNLFV